MARVYCNIICIESELIRIVLLINMFVIILSFLRLSSTVFRRRGKWLRSAKGKEKGGT